MFRASHIKWRFTLMLAVASLFAAAGTTFGWGRIGHRASARLTDSLLTPKTKQAIAAILDNGESLADASLWPDEHRRDIPESSPWHYVNVPITASAYDAKYCQQGGCVISKIADFRKQLADPAATPAQKRLALRFLAHFVQDMHQPVHVGDRSDRGGNDLQLQFFDQGTNLHRLWDSGLLEKGGFDEAAVFQRLQARLTPEYRASVTFGAVESWANESLAAARDAYVDPATGAALKPGTKLSQPYLSKNLPVAEDRVMRSAVRLAWILNETFDPSK